MKALVKRYAEPGLWMEEVPMPQVGVNDVLIKVTKAAICGTDLHMYKWDEWSQSHCTPPYIMGHEFVGVAVEVGPGVRGVAEAGRCRCGAGYGAESDHQRNFGAGGADAAAQGAKAKLLPTAAGAWLYEPHPAHRYSGRSAVYHL